MPRGGKREGAGRKPGAITTKSRQEANRIASDGGIMPLDILTQTMRDLWADAHVGGKVNLGKRMQACALAEKAAPYLHAKLSAVDASLTVQNHEAALDELE